MRYQKLGLWLCTVLVCAIGAASASAQLLSAEQTQQIEQLGNTVCNTVKEQKGSVSRGQIEANVNAKIGGVIGKIIPAGGGAQGSASEEKFEGLSREATATALEGDRACRERLFMRLSSYYFKGAGPAAATTAAAAPSPAPTAAAAPSTAVPAAPAPAPTVAIAPAKTAATAPTTGAPAPPPPAPTAAPGAATTAPLVTTGTDCVVNNPSGRPINVRETPNGAIKTTISNRAQVRPLRFASAADGKPWAYISDASGRETGWAFYPLLSCGGPGIR